jgi:hypothetical protein
MGNRLDGTLFGFARTDTMIRAGSFDFVRPQFRQVNPMHTRFSTLLTLMLVAAHAGADPVTYYAAGSITSAGNATQLFAGVDPNDTVGTPFSAILTYDSDTPATACSARILAGRRCVYEVAPPIHPLGMEVVLPAYDFTFTSADDSPFTAIVDNENGLSLFATDRLSFFSQSIAGFDSITTQSFDLAFSDSTGSALRDEGLKASIPFAQFDSATLLLSMVLGVGPPVEQFFVTGDIDAMFRGVQLVGNPGTSCATVVGLGVALCGDALNGIFFGQPTTTSALPAEAVTALDAIELAGETPQLWELGLGDGFQGGETLTFNYAEGAFCAAPMCVPDVDEDRLTVVHFDEALVAWVAAPAPIRDTVNNTLVIGAAGFPLFALALPEPTSGLAGIVAIVVSAGLAWEARRRRLR